MHHQIADTAIGRSPGRPLLVAGGIRSRAAIFLLFVLVVCATSGCGNKAKDLTESKEKAWALAGGIETYNKQLRDLPRNKVDEEGKVIQSWRAQLLFLIGQRNLSDLMDRDLPCNSPDQPKASEVSATQYIVPQFQSPHAADKELPLTNFVAIANPSAPLYSTERITPDDLKSRDGASNTAVFIEYPESQIRWAEPKDITLTEAIELVKNPTYASGTVVGMADGKAMVIPKTASEEDLTKLFLLDNGAPEGDWWKSKK